MDRKVRRLVIHQIPQKECGLLSNLLYPYLQLLGLQVPSLISGLQLDALGPPRMRAHQMHVRTPGTQLY
jgi:hypothetical protein